MIPAVELGYRLRTAKLAAGYGFEVVETQWNRGEHPARADSMVPHASLEFMLSGCFRKRSALQETMADPNTVVCFQPDERFTIEHPFGDENTSITIRLSRWRFDEAVRDCSLRRASPAIRPMTTHTLTSNQLHLRVRRLHRDLRYGSTNDPLEIEERVTKIVMRVMNDRDHPQRIPSAARRMESAREYLDQRFREKIALDDLSRATGLSPWRLSRLFSERFGLPIHRYLSRLRLREALHGLCEGEDDLTQLALSLGFCSHSHFTAAFRREFGMTPRDARHEWATTDSSRSRRNGFHVE